MSILEIIYSVQWLAHSQIHGSPWLVERHILFIAYWEYLMLLFSND